MRQVASALIAATALSALTSACTTELEGRHVVTGEKPIGQVYYLPKRVFDISATFVVTGCDDTGGKVSFSFDVTPTVVGRLETDEPFFLPYDRLSAATKTTSLKVELTDRGFLKSLNSTVTDKTGDIIATVADGAAKVAVVAARAGLGAGVPNFTNSQTNRKCSTAVKGWLAEIDRLKALLGPDASEDIDLASIPKSTEVVEAQAAYDAAVLTSQNVQASKSVTAIARAEAAVIAAGDALDKAKEKAAEAKKNTKKPKLANDLAKIATLQSTYLTFKSSLTWAPTAASKSARLVVRPELYRQFINEPEGASALPTAEQIAVDVRLFAQDLSALNLLDKAVNDDEATGLRYRQPVWGQLAMCYGSCDAPPPAAAALPAAATAALPAAGINNPIAVFPFSIPQFGFVAALPLKNAVFQNNNIQATWSEDGVLTSLQYGSDATALAAAQTLQKVAGSADSAEQGIYDVTRTRTTNAQTDLTAALTAQKTQAGLYKDITGTPDIDALQKQINYYKKLKELEDAKKEYNASKATP